LVEAIRGLLDDPARRSSLGQAGRQRVLEDFTIERSATTLHQLFASLIATRTNRAYACVSTHEHSKHTMSALMSLVGETGSVSPLVSVIVLAYNSARTIARCMAALVEQETAHRFEVIVVDSGEDETCALAAKVLAKVRVVRVAQRAIPP